MKKSLLCLAAAILLAPAPAPAAPEFELNVSSMLTTIHPVHIHTVAMLKGIEEKSGGRIQFHMFDNNTLVKPDGVVKAVKNGGADLAIVTLNALSSDLPYCRTHDMPFVCTGAYTGSQLMWAMGQLPEIKKELDAGNAELLWAFSGERCAVGSINGPIRRMADLQGKRVLIWQPSLGEEVKGWGGIPVQVGLTDVYVALQRGMGEAFYSAIPMFPSMKLEELVKHLTIMPSVLPGAIWIINKDVMASLPEDLQALLRDGTGEAATLAQGEVLVKAGQNDLQTMRAAGVNIIELTPEELAPWKETSIRSMTPYWRDTLRRGGDKDPDAWIRKVRELAANIEAENGTRP